MTDNGKNIFIASPNPLSGKVKSTGKNVVTQDTLRKAEKVLADMAGDYIIWVKSDLLKIQYAYEDLIGGKVERKECLDQIFSTSHDIKGQGGTFGYTLITQIGNFLCRLIERLDHSLPVEIENKAVQIHIDALHVVIHSNMKGGGGIEGNRILDGIELMGKKLVPEKS